MRGRLAARLISICAWLMLVLLPDVSSAGPSVETQRSPGHEAGGAPILVAQLAAAGPCNLYPIALHRQSLVGVTPGSTVVDVADGVQPGNFGWLSWTGDSSEPALVKSLTPPGDSDTYVNPENAADHVLSVGDWVRGKPGVSNSRGVRDALESLKAIDITVPVWDMAAGQGANSRYRVATFARLRLTDYRLPGQQRITARFLGYADCAAPTRTPTGTPTATLTSTATGTSATTATVTRTPVETPTPTQTPTVTLTPTQTLTVTMTPTLTATATMTAIHTPTLTVTATATATLTPFVPGPELKITGPGNLSVLNSSPISVSGTVDDPAATVVVNGVTASVSGGGFTANGVILREGRNTITAVARNTRGGVSSASILVIRDATPPTAVIQSPRDGLRTADATISVAGAVHDMVAGSVNAEDVRVTCNGQGATVDNQSFLVTGLALQPGANTILCTATDKAGNSRQSAPIQVTRQTLAGQRIERVSGEGQSAAAGAELGQPLVVRLLNAAGQPIVGRAVTFKVTRGGGTLTGDKRELDVPTDANGRASIRFRLGGRSGLGNHQVTATAAGFAGEALFEATATPGGPDRIVSVSGDTQRGLVGQDLPHPLVVLVTDANGNALSAVPVTFAVTRGGGHLDGQTSRTVQTNDDGRASVVLTLGPRAGANGSVVTARINVSGRAPVTFTSTAVQAGRVEDTRVSGVVLDNANVAIPGATVRIVGTQLSARTDQQGLFTIENAPVGTIHLAIDGSTSPRAPKFPGLEFELVTLPGQVNTVGIPILIPAIDTSGGKTCGGAQACEIEMAGVAGAKLIVAPNSVTFKDGSRTGVIQFTQVHADKVPMAPPNGSIFFPAWTIQPAGAHFDPPARVQVPNTDGLPPGAQTELFQFDHDVEEFVSIGTGTVSADGSVILTDPGFGITKAGWGGRAAPPPPIGCLFSLFGCGNDPTPTPPSTPTPPQTPTPTPGTPSPTTTFTPTATFTPTPCPTSAAGTPTPCPTPTVTPTATSTATSTTTATPTPTGTPGTATPTVTGTPPTPTPTSTATTLTITSLSLNDIDNLPLRFLSTDLHNYFNGNTRIHGTISIEGPGDDELTSLVLEIIEGGQTVATANLSQSIQGILFHPFGSAGRIEVSASTLLFELSSSQSSQINRSTNGVIALQARADSAKGAQAVRAFGSVPKLVLFTGSNRYGTRDDDQGGDGWVKPSVKDTLGRFAGALWGDLSNMNGGSFALNGHNDHQTGNDADGFVEGYYLIGPDGQPVRDTDGNRIVTASAANKLIGFLNVPVYGSKVRFILVTYEESDTNQFWTTIRNVTLNDGRLARNVFRPKSGHDGHFHMFIED